MHVRAGLEATAGRCDVAEVTLNTTLNELLGAGGGVVLGCLPTVLMRRVSGLFSP